MNGPTRPTQPTQPERHYPAKLNQEYARTYTDWEAVLGSGQAWADRIMSVLGNKPLLLRDDEMPLLQPALDITMIQMTDVGPDEVTDADILVTFHTVWNMLTTEYFVASGGKWTTRLDESGRKVLTGFNHPEMTKE
jgi:hypothetical protein